METLESSRVCRLCGKQSGISINIFDKNESHVKKINAILPIMVHEMDLLPKHMCHRCSYKLEEFHNFYVDCLKTDANLKGQLSWMRKEDPKERVGVPMVHIENINMKVEPPDYDVYDVNPMVDNVDYISSVTFPVNGVQSNEIPEQITYTAYTRCGCYCDKADQSNQPVPAKYDNRISRCSSVQNNVKPHSHSCANRLAIVPDFPDEEPEKSSVVRFNNNDRKPCDSTSSTLNPSKIKSSKNKKASKNTRIVRNLRPRRKSVDYVGRKKKHVALSSDKSNRSINVTRIKAEELNHFHGHMLRPRKGFVDYLGPKRKYRRSATKNQRSQSDGNGSAENKVRNIASKLQLPPKEVPNLWKSRAMLNVKTEQLTDFEEATLDEPISSAVLSLKEDCDVKSKIETLPNFDASQQDDRVNRNAFDYPRSSDGRFLSTDNWKPLRSVSKRKSKSEKIKSNRTNKTNTYPLKNLRSQNSCLRNGKVIKIDNGEALRKLRKNHRNLPGKGRTVGKNLMQVVSGTVAERKMSASSTKLIEIKHYCETCNSRFVNKELFKLHACYGHSFYLHNRG